MARPWRDPLRLIILGVVLPMVFGGFSLITGLSWQLARGFTSMPCTGASGDLGDFGFDSQQVEFINDDGATLTGHFSPGSKYPGLVIIIVPGASSDTGAGVPDALLLAAAGFGTFIYEHRSCADPSLLHSGGLLEAQDIRSAVRFLKTFPNIERIGALGTSTGGSAAILAAAEEPAIEGVVAAGGFSSLADDILDPHLERPLYERLMRWLALIFIGYQLGIPPGEISPVDRIESISPRPVLLIYGELESEHGRALFSSAGPPKELWIIPGARHAAYGATDPATYSTRITNFFLALAP